MEKKAIELKKGQTFKIKGKRKIYQVEDIFTDYFAVVIVYRIKGGNFSKLRLPKNEIVIVL